jgi:hypothetical protein
MLRTAAVAALLLFLTGCSTGPTYLEPYTPGDGAAVGEHFDLDQRNADFPNTYIAEVGLDLTRLEATLRWTGPAAEQMPTGPYPTSVGAGLPGLDGDSVRVSNRRDTYLTPKGTHPVLGFSDHLRQTPECHYVTWIDLERTLALHSHWFIPDFPASHGCVRLPYEAAKLIHNNSRVALTKVTVAGRWQPPPEEWSWQTTPPPPPGLVPPGQSPAVVLPGQGEGANRFANRVEPKSGVFPADTAADD